MTVQRVNSNAPWCSSPWSARLWRRGWSPAGDTQLTRLSYRSDAAGWGADDKRVLMPRAVASLCAGGPSIHAR